MFKFVGPSDKKIQKYEYGQVSDLMNCQRRFNVDIMIS